MYIFPTIYFHLRTMQFAVKFNEMVPERISNFASKTL